MSLVERVHTFGPDGGMVGIVTLPPEPLLEASASRPFVLLLNAGLVHRVGPFGMGVQLARTLAARGTRVLRFDQTGLGDSPANPARTPVAEQVVADGRAAMDSLAAQYGARTFVIGGLCSGALNAHRICLADPRAVGMWMLDGYAYPTGIYQRHLLLRRLRSRASWRALGRKIVAVARARVSAILDGAPAAAAAPVVAGDDRESIFYQEWPDPAVARAEIERMLARGVRLLFVYTGGWSSFVDPRQFDEMFPRLGRRDQVKITYFPRADHSYLALEDREGMLRDVTAFVGAIS